MVFEVDADPGVIALALGATVLAACTTAPPPAAAQAPFNASGKTLRQIYEYLHINPELSFQEKNSSAILAAEMKRLGFTVTTGVSIFGICRTVRRW